LFANSDNDNIFPMDANRRIIAKLRSIYKMYGKPDLVDEYVSKGGHAYRPDLRIAILKWINQHTKNDTTTPVEDTKFAELPGMLLRVFRDDADVPKDAINAKIDETFVPRAKVELPEKEKFDEWRKGLLTKLRKQTFVSIPNKSSVTTEPSFPFSMNVFGEIHSEPPLHTWQAHMVVESNKERSPYEILIVMSESIDRFGEAGYPRAPKWAVPYCDATHASAIFLRGVDPYTKWTQKSPPNFVERSNLLLGRTTDQGRVWDIVACLRQVSGKKKRFGEVKLVARGQVGIVAAYAALFEPSIKEVVIIDPPKSHKEGPHFLGVLRVLDIPEALGLLAPNVKLTLINARDPAFDRTEQIYKLAGAADKLVRK
jgi:hypothetical protein